MVHRKTSKRSKQRIMLRLADLEQSRNAVQCAFSIAIARGNRMLFSK